MLERYNKMKLIRMSDKPVLEPIKDNQWEKAAVFNAAMVYVNGVFHMIYRATGIDGENSVNMNSGAESTIECLSAIQMRGEL
jgi:predicted GH43/DUF377 family glycosyl hydrolase